ncbi:MAG: ParB N-terminal domain-containing protein, partial [Clostridia bacterium]
MMTIMTKTGELALPCMEVKVVPMEKIIANNYNPNHVSDQNMELLHQSIADNGMCYAVVTIYDDVIDRYIIIDGFHRYSDLKDVWGAIECPVIVLRHDIKQRMAATVQFNRARGIHQVELMGDLVQALVEQGASDEDIAKHLGME